MAKEKKIESNQSNTKIQLQARLLLDTIYQAKEISRPELTQKLNINSITIKKLTSELVRSGILAEQEGKTKREHRAGRPATLLKINEQGKLVLSIDLEPDCIRIALINLNLAVIAFSEYTNNRFLSSDKILAQIISACEKLLSANSIWREKIIGIGVSLPGLVDVENGISRSSTNMPNWHNVAIVEELGNVFHLPVMIGKSVHLAALSEKWRRPEIQDRNVLCLVLRTGVGVAMLIKGNLYLGAKNLDGEIGHTIIDINGKQCECGKKGCLETFISSSAIKQRAINLIQKGKANKLLEEVSGQAEDITVEIIYKLAKEGDADCIQIVRDLTNYLGLAIANLIQIFNPHELVICGSIDIAEELVLEEMNLVLKKMVLTESISDLKVFLSPHKERASLIGAVCMVLEHFFSCSIPTDDSLKP